MSFALVLSKSPNSTVAIQRKSVRELLTYQKHLIRFIYSCYTKPQAGALLNIDVGFNYELACAHALAALQQLQNITVILCKAERYLFWLYFMKKHSGLDVFKVTAANIEKLLHNNKKLVLIATENDQVVLKDCLQQTHSCLIVDGIDYFISKRITKMIKANFYIGITHRNFVTDPDLNLQWKITRWVTNDTNAIFKTFNKFVEYNNIYLAQDVDPYTSFWYTLRRDTKDSIDIQDREDTERKITDWAKSAGYNFESPQKRKPQSEPDTSTEDKKLCFTKTISDYIADLSVFDTSLNESVASEQTSPRVKTYRMKKPKADTLRRTKSEAPAIVVDEHVIDEFSKPFEPHKNKVHSDTSLLDTTRNHRVSDEDEDELSIVQEFSSSFETPKPPEALRLLLSGEIAKESQPKQSSPFISQGVNRNFERETDADDSDGENFLLQYLSSPARNTSVVIQDGKRDAPDTAPEEENFLSGYL